MEEVVMARFKVLSWHLPGGTKDSQSLGQDLYPGHSEYEAGELTICYDV
jgi:hypothetical protein